MFLEEANAAYISTNQTIFQSNSRGILSYVTRFCGEVDFPVTRAVALGAGPTPSAGRASFPQLCSDRVTVHCTEPAADSSLVHTAAPQAAPGKLGGGLGPWCLRLPLCSAPSIFRVREGQMGAGIAPT